MQPFTTRTAVVEDAAAMAALVTQPGYESVPSEVSDLHTRGRGGTAAGARVAPES